jgi:hypothetical protein
MKVSVVTAPEDKLLCNCFPPDANVERSQVGEGERPDKSA